MRNSKYLLFCCTLFYCVLLWSCSKNDPAPIAGAGKVHLKFKSESDGTAITGGGLYYSNELNELYSVNLLKYYMSYATLIDADGNEVTLFDHKLIDALELSNELAVSNVPNGHYVRLRFNLGIDEEHNHTGDQDGDLDPINGMVWSWNTGYIFFKHEGQFQTAMGGHDEITYHYGTDAALVSVEIPIDLVVFANTVGVDVIFNLNQLYRAPNIIQFEGNNLHQSVLTGDAGWLAALKENFSHSFSVVSH